MYGIPIQEINFPVSMDQETKQFLGLLTSGMRFRDIAEKCGGHPTTVRNRGNRLHRLLGLRSRLELANVFLKLEALDASEIQAHFNQKSHRLTRREIEILIQMIQHPEQTRAQAARQLGISEDTLRVHLNALYRKTNTTNRYCLSALVANTCRRPPLPGGGTHA